MSAPEATQATRARASRAAVAVALPIWRALSRDIGTGLGPQASAPSLTL